MYIYNLYKIQLQWIKYNFYGCDQGYHEPLRLNLLNKGYFQNKWVFSEDFKIVNDWGCQMLIRNIDDYNDVFDVDNAVDGCDYDDSF